MSERVVIVGAGPGGLASAILLASSGCDVTVLERAERPGGRSAALEMEGFRFDSGATFFLYPRVLEEIFWAAGRDLRSEVELVRLDPQYRIAFGAGGVIDATPDRERMKAQLAALDEHDAQAFDGFLEDNRRKLDLFKPVLESSFDGWGDLLQPSLRAALPVLRPHRSLERDLRSHFRDPRVRLAFSFQSKYLGMSPFRCPSLFSILSFLEYEYGVWHPIGGCSALLEAMARVAADIGVDLRYGEAVESLDFEGRRVTAAHTSRGRYPADAVVMNADFARAMQRLVPDRLRRRWKNRKIARKRFSCSTFMLYLGIDGELPGLPHHTIHIAEDYRRNLDDIERRHVLSDDPSFYVQHATATDPTLAPPGCSTLYVLVPVTHQHPNVDWSREREGYRRLAIRQLEQRLGLRDLESRIRAEKVVTPDDWSRDFEVHRGATFNLAHSFRQMLHLRPHNRFEDVDAMYLVGGGTHPGSGLPVIFESARISSRLLVKDLGREPHWSFAPSDSAP
ncbi:MAG: phytoene desaturase family protein, partial [Thermoanaerobaculia bacterium]|nr:phytoene desaturase family protein [Thermoanaerobaculia bacterium]